MLSQLQLTVPRQVPGAVDSVNLWVKLLHRDHKFSAGVHALVVQLQRIGFVTNIGLNAVKLSVKSIQGIPGNE